MKAKNPRHGSMQVWPRKRANRPTARVRSWNKKDSGLLGFVGYKAGMTQVLVTDAHKTSMNKGEEVMVPATIIECPPIKIYAVRAYTKDVKGLKVATEIVVGKDKNLLRRLFTKKAQEVKALDALNKPEYTLSILTFTQPSLTGIGKKKPEIIELHLGGSNEEILTFVKEHLTSGIKMSEIFKEGDYIDAHAITKGKGHQGSVKRFGVALTSHKSEKKRRGPGSLGGWKGHAHFMYRVAFPGQMGYHQRVQYNNQIIKIGEKVDEVNPVSGFINFGLVKNEFLVLKGSVPGPKKRLITMVKGIRVKKLQTPPTVERISTRSQQR